MVLNVEGVTSTNKILAGLLRCRRIKCKLRLDTLSIDLFDL